MTVSIIENVLKSVVGVQPANRSYNLRLEEARAKQQAIQARLRLEEKTEGMKKKQKKLAKKFAKLEKAAAKNNVKVVAPETVLQKEVQAESLPVFNGTAKTEMTMSLNTEGKLVNDGPVQIKASPAPVEVVSDPQDYQFILEAAIAEGSDPAVVEANYRKVNGLEPATEENSLVPAAIAAAAAANPEAANTAMGNALMNHSRGRNRQRGQNHGRGQQHRQRDE